MRYKQGDFVRWTNSAQLYLPEILRPAQGVVVGPLDLTEFDLGEVGQMYVIDLELEDGPVVRGVQAFEDELEAAV